MELYIVDAFTDQVFGGNQAGVVLLGEHDDFLDDSVLLKIASELKHSETAFVKALNESTFQIRYFTPLSEVPLCGHATISVFTVLRNERKHDCSSYIARTKAGDLSVFVEPNRIWLEMAKGTYIKQLTPDERARIYHAYNLETTDQPENMFPCIINTGLSDILLPVNSKIKLDGAIQNREEITAISSELGVVGVHMFYCPSNDQTTAFCRNFAPLFGIDEECATGTSNASLTFYLNSIHRIKIGRVNTIIQGEAMGRPSVILSRMEEDNKIYIGGNAVISVTGKIRI